MRMIFAIFAVGIAVVLCISSISPPNYGRYLGLRYLRASGSDSMTGLPTMESAVFALIGLLLAFTVSGALHRFDERRHLVLQEANAVSTAYDRLGLFEAEVARGLQSRLKDYVQARIDLYRMPHDFSLWEGAEVWSRDQHDKIFELKTKVWDAVTAACPQANFRPACCKTSAGTCSGLRSRPTARGRCGKTSAAYCLYDAVRPQPRRVAPCGLRHGRGQGPQLDYTW